MGPGWTHSERFVPFSSHISSKAKFLVLSSIVYSVVLDPTRNQACSGSMDGTVRVWNLSTGQCAHTLTGHTSLVGLLGLSPSHLVSAAADSTLRIWDPSTGTLIHTLAAHTGAITCFQHDEFKVLSGSDGTLKMWDVRDGGVVRDLLVGITGVWQVVFEGRWGVAASNREDRTVLDVWDFADGEEGAEEWIGEPPGGLYDEGDDDEDDEDQSQADADAMDQDLLPNEVEVVDADVDTRVDIHEAQEEEDEEVEVIVVEDEDMESRAGSVDMEAGGLAASRWAPAPSSTSTLESSSSRSSRLPRGAPTPGGDSSTAAVASSSTSTSRRGGSTHSISDSDLISAGIGARPLPSNDETPTRPRVRNHGVGTRRRVQ